MASDAERKAGFAAAKNGIQEIISSLRVFERGPAQAAFDQHPDKLQALVDGVLDAAEKERAAK